MLIVLLVFTGLLIAAGIGLLVAMQWRDQPPLGLGGLALLIAAGVPASVYGVISST